MILFEFILFWKVNLLPGECERFPETRSKFSAERCYTDFATHSLLLLCCKKLFLSYSLLSTSHTQTNVS